MRVLTTLLICLGVAACSEPAPKTGALPGVATGGYDAPSNAEAAAAYMGGFHERYDIPKLDYPQEIKDRIRKARFEQFERFMRKGQNRTEMMAKLALMVSNDPEAKELYKEMNKAPKAELDAEEMTRLFALANSHSNKDRISKSQRNKIYKTAVKEYKRHFINLKVESCRWTKMRRLIGSGHEEMAFIHGHHPTHGFYCSADLTLEKNKGYPRTSNFNGFWVKSQSGDWEYFGKFYRVEIRPRRQQLNPALLRDPEGTLKRQSMGDMIASSFN